MSVEIHIKEKSSFCEIFKTNVYSQKRISKYIHLNINSLRTTISLYKQQFISKTSIYFADVYSPHKMTILSNMNVASENSVHSPHKMTILSNMNVHLRTTFIVLINNHSFKHECVAFENSVHSPHTITILSNMNVASENNV